MLPIHHVSRRAAITATTALPRRLSRRWYSLERTQIKIPHTRSTSAPFPVIESCPSPTCQCRDMPQGLEIEREQDLNGSMAAYAEQVLISTGQANWKSRIEDGDGVHGDAVRGLKGLLGPRGKFGDVGSTNKCTVAVAAAQAKYYFRSPITTSSSPRLPSLQRRPRSRAQLNSLCRPSSCLLSPTSRIFPSAMRLTWKSWSRPSCFLQNCTNPMIASQKRSRTFSSGSLSYKDSSQMPEE